MELILVHKGDGKLEGREYVEYLLKNYHQIKREVEVAKALLEIRICESEEEIIEEMNFHTFKGEKVKHRNIADKTANIAIGYKEEQRVRELHRIRDLKRDIRRKEVDLLKVKAAVEVLEDRHQRVIKGIYFQGKTRVQLCRELYISEGTLNRWKRKAVETMEGVI